MMAVVRNMDLILKIIGFITSIPMANGSSLRKATEKEVADAKEAREREELLSKWFNHGSNPLPKETNSEVTPKEIRTVDFDEDHGA